LIWGAALSSPQTQMEQPKRIAVIGSGISGLSAAWLLHRCALRREWKRGECSIKKGWTLQHQECAICEPLTHTSRSSSHRAGHHVTIYEAEERCGGHTLTDEACGVAVDLGFQVRFFVWRCSGCRLQLRWLIHSPCSLLCSCMAYPCPYARYQLGLGCTAEALFLGPAAAAAACCCETAACSLPRPPTGLQPHHLPTPGGVPGDSGGRDGALWHVLLPVHRQRQTGVVSDGGARRKGRASGRHGDETREAAAHAACLPRNPSSRPAPTQHITRPANINRASVGDLDTVFAQRSNLLSPTFLRMVRDVVRFGSEAPKVRCCCCRRRRRCNQSGDRS